MKNLTPKERMAKKKEMETLRKIQEAKDYAGQASHNYAKAQEMKYQQLYAGKVPNQHPQMQPFSAGSTMEQTVIHAKMNPQAFNQQP